LLIVSLESDLSFPNIFIGNPAVFQITASGFPLKDLPTGRQAAGMTTYSQLFMTLCIPYYS